MKRGFAISLIAHAVILSWGFIVLSKPMSFDAMQSEALPVSLVPIDDVMSIKKGELTASQENKAAPKQTTKPEEKPDAKNTGEGSVDSSAPLKPKEKPREVDTTRPSSGTDSPDVVPPKDVPQEKKSEEQKVEEKQQTPPKTESNPDAASQADDKTPAPTDTPVNLPDSVPTPTQKPSTAPQQPQENNDRKSNKAASGEKTEDDVDQLIKEALLVDKTKTQGGGAKRSSSPAGFGASKDIGEDNKLAQSFANIIATCVQSKFNIVALGGGTQSDLRVKAHFYLKNDGNLDGTPDITASGGDNRQQEVGINQARAALISCAPFPLPGDKFGIWREIEMVFDPYQTISPSH